MQCILIGVVNPPGDRNTTTSWLWQTVTDHVKIVNNHEVNWIATSEATDEGTPTQLLCATSDASVEDVVAATSHALLDIVGNGGGDGGYSCELWASAPAILPLRPMDGYRKHLTRDTANIGIYDTLLSEDQRQLKWSSLTMKEWGMFTQNSLLDDGEVEQLRTFVHEEISTIETLIQIHKPEINIGKDSMSFQEIASRGNDRFDLLLEPTSKAYDFVKQNILDRVQLSVETILDGRVVNAAAAETGIDNSGNVNGGGDIDFDLSVVYSKPGAPNQGWHADGDHQRGTNDAGWDINGWQTQLAEPYALCLFIPLINLDDKTGYTQFWPASHRSRGFAGFGPVAELTEATYDGKCKAGDAIWYDYRCMHRGIQNISNDVLRPVVQVLFKKSWYVEKRNYGTESLRKQQQHA